MAKALSLKLSHEGFETEIAHDGQEALDMVKKKKKSYQLILLDLMMPKMDGFTFLAELKKEKIKIPTIVSSNLSQPEDIDRAKSLGAKDFFVKSDTPLSEVVSKVQKLI